MKTGYKLIGLFLVLSLSAVTRADIYEEEDVFTEGSHPMCGPIRCYDSCQKRFVEVFGNQCGKSFDVGCFHAIGLCNGHPSNPIGPAPLCNYKPCYDQCTGRYILLRVNVCTKVFNPLKGCYQASGYCQ